ncbi:MAG: sulfatase [Planctomycetaceae bacterium]
MTRAAQASRPQARRRRQGSRTRARTLAAIAWLTCLTLLMAERVRADDAPPARPNVLFIAIDDLNDWVEPLGGHPQVQTPHMTRLAARGVNFTNAHCQSPLCNPCRTSLMTGLRPSTTGVYCLAPWFREVEPLKDVVTLSQHFTSNGYHTYTTGKIFHGGYPPKPQREREFTHWGVPSAVGARPEQKLVTTPGGNHPLVDWGTFPHRDEDKGDYKVASWAVQQLEGELPEPFFLSVGFFLPHVPCYATQKWFDLYPLETLQLPPVLAGDRDDTPEVSWYLHWKLPEVRLSWLEEQDQWKPLVQAYLASTSFVDSQVGRVLDALEASGHADDTIVVLWSDHGWHLGEKAITGKNTLWDRSTRVPLIFAGPGIVQGQKCAEPVELLDIYPTLVELCSLPQPAIPPALRERVRGLEGESLVRLLHDPASHRKRPAITTHNVDNHGVRTRDWRYIRYADGSEELYDMRSDPNEWHNLAGDQAHAATVQELARWLPRVNMQPVPGSAHRLLVREGDDWLWEGEPIDPNEAEK